MSKEIKEIKIKEILKNNKEYEVSIEHKENNITLVNFKLSKGMTHKEAFDFLEEIRNHI
jgi:hypothetical protein